MISIIPSFQSEKYIGSVLKSISRQTYTDYEVLVMDGGSSDRIAGIAASNETLLLPSKLLHWLRPKCLIITV